MEADCDAKLRVVNVIHVHRGPGLQCFLAVCFGALVLRFDRLCCSRLLTPQQGYETEAIFSNMTDNV